MNINDQLANVLKNINIIAKFNTDVKLITTNSTPNIVCSINTDQTLVPRYYYWEAGDVRLVCDPTALYLIGPEGTKELLQYESYETMLS